MDFYKTTWRRYVLTVRAHDRDRVEQFEHTRAICYMVAIQYFGTNRPTMEEFWPLATDEVAQISPDDMLAYMRKVQAEYDEQTRLNQLANA